VSTHVTSCPLLSHSLWPQRSCRKNPCYNRPMEQNHTLMPTRIRAAAPPEPKHVAPKSEVRRRRINNLQPLDPKCHHYVTIFGTVNSLPTSSQPLTISTCENGDISRLRMSRVPRSLNSQLSTLNSMRLCVSALKSSSHESRRFPISSGFQNAVKMQSKCSQNAVKIRTKTRMRIL
jgi:hypothetical protein